MNKLMFVLPAMLAVACAPSINPQMKSATDSLIASVRGGHDEAAPASYEPMPWAVGQWTLSRVTSTKDGRTSVVKSSVIGAEGGGFWVESETQDYYQRSVSKILYAGMPRTSEEAVDQMLKMVSWTEGKERQELDFTDASNPGMAFTKRLMKSYAQGMFVPDGIEASVKEDVSVPAGSFRGCARIDVKTSLGPVLSDSTSWFHPKVPLSGAVKGVSKDGAWTVELLDYGLTGAASAL